MIRLKDGEQILQKKSCGQLVHVSDFINEETGHLFIPNPDGTISDENDAHKIIYPGSTGDPWWDTKQLLDQMHTKAIPIFKCAYPGCQALFIFNQSSVHASLGPNALNAFDMNKSNGGKQRMQQDTVIPDDETFPKVLVHGAVQKMTTNSGNAKGIKAVLIECGFDTKGKHAKCKPVCPFENKDCCLAHLLSHQSDFTNQISMLEELVTVAGHLCIFLPKFHCELNPIEMVHALASH